MFETERTSFMERAKSIGGNAVIFTSKESEDTKVIVYE